MVEILQLSIMVVSLALSMVLKRPVECKAVETPSVVRSSDTVHQEVYAYEASVAHVSSCVASGLQPERF